ncbi:phage terminase small subunit, partial [Angulomicrobium tetraedrale]
EAARRAGYAEHTARFMASRILRNPDVAAAIRMAMAERARRTQIDADAVLHRWWATATANPNDVIQHIRGACRYCHGTDHAYQWRDRREFRTALAQARAKMEPDDLLPSEEGGFGYNALAEPHPECPRCDGIGESMVVALATNSPLATPLYDGLKKTKDGIEFHLADRAKALEMVARHLGMFNDKLKLQGDAENPLTVLLREIQGSSLQPVADPIDDD